MFIFPSFLVNHDNNSHCSFINIFGPNSIKNVNAKAPISRKSFLEIFLSFMYFFMWLFWHSSGRENLFSTGCCANTGCPKKNRDPCSMGYRGHQKWSKDKSRVSFEKFWKFPIKCTKTPTFCKKNSWEKRGQRWLPPLKNWKIFLGCFFKTHPTFVFSPLLVPSIAH